MGDLEKGKQNLTLLAIFFKSAHSQGITVWTVSPYM